MSLLDVQHIKRSQTRFQGTQVSKDIHLLLKGEYVAIMGNQDPGNQLSSISSHA